MVKGSNRGARRVIDSKRWDAHGEDRQRVQEACGCSLLSLRGIQDGKSQQDKCGRRAEGGR